MFFLGNCVDSTATMDFLVILDRDFDNLVVNKLSRSSWEAFSRQQSPHTMADIARKRIHREIMHTVFGKLLTVIFGGVLYNSRNRKKGKFAL